MTADPVAVARVRSFIQLAREEFQVARELKVSHRRQSAYFLQQAVEKALRGLIEASGKAAGPTHSIRGLSDILPKDHGMRERFIALEPLSAAATRYRYPSASGSLLDVGERQLNELHELAAAVIADALTMLETYLSQADQSGR